MVAKKATTTKKATATKKTTKSSAKTKKTAETGVEAAVESVPIGDFGAKLDAKLAGADIRLAPSEPLKVVGLQRYATERDEQTRELRLLDQPDTVETLTVSGLEKAHGIFILGPGTDLAGRGAKETLVDRAKAYHWIYQPCILRAGQTIDAEGKIKSVHGNHPNVVVSRGSICLYSKAVMECPKCGQHNVMWRDQAKRDENAGNNHCQQQACLDIGFNAEGEGFKGYKMSITPMQTVLVGDRAESKYNDPLFGSVADPRIEAMHKFWNNAPQVREPVFLPRLWALYRADSPLDFTDGCKAWTPQDAKAQAIEKAARDHSPELTIRPFKMLMDAQNEALIQLKKDGGGTYEGTGLYTLVLEVPCSFSIGWVTRTDVRGGQPKDDGKVEDVLDLGFTRRFEFKQVKRDNRKIRL
jgi:hypothetical protein